MVLGEQAKRGLAVGIDIGGTKVLAVVASDDGQPLASVVVPTPAESPAPVVVQALADAAHAAIQRAGLRPRDICAVGVAAAGAVDSTQGVVVHSPHLPTFKQTPVAAMLREAMGLPVVIANDANLAALGEHRFGAGRGVSDMLYITISTGIGGGIIAGNRLLLGAGGYAGEVGHMSVDAHGPYGKSSTPGAWESLSSGSALARIVTERIQAGAASSLAPTVRQGGEITALDVFAAARAGDALCKAVIQEGIEYTGIALTNLVNLLNPAMIIIGGGLSNEWETYIEPAVAIMRKLSFAGIGATVPVVPAALGAAPGALGAAALALDTVAATNPHVDA